MVKFFKNILYVFGLILMSVHGIDCSSRSTPERSYTLIAAGVLPIIYDEDPNKRTALLGRQAIGFDLGKWEYFGGFTKNEKDNDPWRDGAAEWGEESLLEKILGWNVDDTKKYIRDNLKGYIVLVTHDQLVGNQKLNTYGVMYIVSITPEIRDRILISFDSSRKAIMGIAASDSAKAEELSDFLEVDKLIEVNWNDLLQSAIPHKKRKDKRPIVLKNISENGFRDSITLRNTFRDLLEGMTDENKYESPNARKNLPVGVFIAARQQDNKSWQSEHFSWFSLEANIKEYLNKIVIDNLGLDEKIKQAAALKKMNQEKAPDIHETARIVTPELVEVAASSNIPPQAPLSSFPEASKLAAIHALSIVSKKPDDPESTKPLPMKKDQDKNIKNNPDHSFDLWEIIGNALIFGFEKAVNAFKYIFNEMSAFFRAS